MTPWLIFTRDVQLAFRRGGGAAGVCGFCLIAYTAFAFALGPEALSRYGLCVLAVCVFFSCLLALPQLFEADAQDGTLEQYLAAPAPLETIIAAKIAAFWVAACAPLIALSPLLGVMAGMEWGAAVHAAGVLALTTPALSAIGALGAALTLSVRGSGFTQALVTLPLYIPPLIFAASGEGAATWLLAALSCASVPLSCLLSALLIRLTFE